MARTSWDDYWQKCWKWKLTEKFLKSTLRQFVCQIKITLKYFFYCVFRTKFKALQKWFWPVILWFMKLFLRLSKREKAQNSRFFPLKSKIAFLEFQGVVVNMRTRQHCQEKWSWKLHPWDVESGKKPAKWCKCSTTKTTESVVKHYGNMTGKNLK